MAGDHALVSGSALVTILVFGCLQNIFWRLADRNGIRRPHEGYYRASVLSFISEERDSIGDIYVDDLPTFVSALYLLKWACCS
jgi:hypothetical protein